MANLFFLRMVLAMCMMLNAMGMLILYASARDDVLMKWRFRKAKMAYQQPWITPRVAIWLVVTLGFLSGCLGLLFTLLGE